MKLIVLLFMVLLLKPLHARDALAIIRFSNTSNDAVYGLNRGQSSALIHSLMENLAVRLSAYYTIVERNKMDAFLDEFELSESGYFSEKNSLQMGRMTGARYLLTGGITEFSKNVTDTKAYGINSSDVIYRLILVYKLLDIETGELLYGDEIEVTESFTNTLGGKTRDDGVASKLCRKAADKVKNRFGSYFKQVRELELKKIEEAKPLIYHFTLKGTPEGAKVDIDGFYEGSLPLLIELKEGVHKIRVYKPGYLEESMNVRADQKRNIQFELRKEGE